MLTFWGTWCGPCIKEIPDFIELYDKYNNEGLEIDTLKVAKVFVDEGPTMKRIMPRAKGRADRINKRTSHITVVVSER